MKKLQLVILAAVGLILGITGSAQAAPLDITLIGAAVDLSTVNTTIGAVFISIITVIGFVWAGRKIVAMFRGS